MATKKPHPDTEDHHINGEKENLTFLSLQSQSFCASSIWLNSGFTNSSENLSSKSSDSGIADEDSSFVKHWNLHFYKTMAVILRKQTHRLLA
jgi:hypothetical protein